MHVTASPSKSLPKAKAARDKWHGVFVFLLAADAVVLLIYLLLLPNNSWELADGRLRGIGSLVTSVLAYLGLNHWLERRSANAAELIGSSSFRAILLFVTLILWSAVLPVWSYQFVFNPPQTSPPAIEIGGRSRQLMYIAKQTRQGERIAQLDGLLLRNYDYKVAGSREENFLPALSIIKGTFLTRPIEVKLPCTVELPLLPDAATVFYRRYPWDREEIYGSLPGDGKIFLMEGHYDYVRVETKTEIGSSALEVKCPSTNLGIEMQRKEP